MNLEIIKKTNDEMHVRLKGSNDAFVNAMRRFAMDEVPTLAVDDAEFVDNSSGLYDEIVAHRLGLIPIKTDISSYRLPKSPEEVQEKSASCTLQLTLKSSKKGIVYAEEASSKDPNCTFALPKMPIVKLLPKQKLDVNMLAVMGQGKEHSKWSPGLVYFRKEAVVRANIKLTDEQKVRIHKACDDLVQVDNNVKVNADELAVSQRHDACLAVLEEVGAEVKETDNFILSVESWGQLNCKEILEQAATMFVQKLNELEDQIK